MKSGKSEHLVQVAKNLFYQNGFHNVGIERILKEAEISKTTLYKHFPSKDALVVATLEAWGSYLTERLERIIAERTKDAISEVEALFILLARMSREKGFNGDMFLNALSEYNDSKHIVYKAAKSFKENQWSWILDKTIEARVLEPTKVARQVVLLYEGTVAAMKVSKDQVITDFAKRQVRQLYTAAKKRAVI